MTQKILIEAPFFAAASQLLTLLMVSSICGLAYNFFSTGGLLADIRSTYQVSSAEVNIVPQSVTLDEVRLARSLGDAIIVDARLGADFEKGHIPGAISVPVNSPRYIRIQKLDGARPDTPVIVYCQSDTCEFSNEVARDLAMDGFLNVKVYPDGWNGWQASMLQK